MLRLEEYLRMCDSGLTGTPAPSIAQYKNPFNPETHIWRYPSKLLKVTAFFTQILVFFSGRVPQGQRPGSEIVHCMNFVIRGTVFG